ncbi:hypothetical protein [Bacillus rubiinfantis]|uniref:hypothetical protein n=1 Tax=Bacillus rubiinfantis TaxID=1499680 RepID=UPI0005A88036|nr:hypothetical protein [Bacillus rubiinfantis]
MYLTLKDLAALFPEKRGIDDILSFHTVSDRADLSQPKGLFISLNNVSDQLSKAIANGAIAAIWQQGEELPPYIPNQFPVFYTADLAESVIKLLEFYIDKLNGETNNKMQYTNFQFSSKKLHNKNNQTYDIAVLLNKLVAIQEGRG